MRIEIYFDEFMQIEEREIFLSKLEKCNTGEEIGELFDIFNGLYLGDPNRVYIFSRNKKFISYGNIEVD